MLEIVLLPGLLAAGIGSLIFVGLDNLTGFGLFVAHHLRHPRGRVADRS